MAEQRQLLDGGALPVLALVQVVDQLLGIGHTDEARAISLGGAACRVEHLVAVSGSEDHQRARQVGFSALELRQLTHGLADEHHLVARAVVVLAAGDGDQFGSQGLLGGCCG
ncbi:hypothetical protein D9M69_569440 [compost metagenome]